MKKSRINYFSRKMKENINKNNIRGQIKWKSQKEKRCSIKFKKKMISRNIVTNSKTDFIKQRQYTRNTGNRKKHVHKYILQQKDVYLKVC